MACTKQKIVEALVGKMENPNKDLAFVVESLIETIKESLEAGEDVMISGFGKFCVKKKGKRKGRNPATGESMTLPSRKVVTFNCSGKLRDKINLKTTII